VRRALMSEVLTRQFGERTASSRLDGVRIEAGRRQGVGVAGDDG
jgi:hypothetical protein